MMAWDASITVIRDIFGASEAVEMIRTARTADPMLNGIKKPQPPKLWKMKLATPDLYGGFLNWGYPNSWMVYKGTSQSING